MFTLFSKAAQNLPLTPAERAFLKLLKGWLYTALISGLTAGAQYLGAGQLDWIRLAYIAGGAFVLSVLHALDKYFTAQGDTTAALVTQVAEKQIQQQITQKTTEPQPITFPGINNSPTQAPALLKNQFQTPPTGLSTINLQPNLSATGTAVGFPNDLHFGDTNVGLPTV